MNQASQINAKVCSAGVAAGTTEIDATHVDMQGWDGVLFAFIFGTLTAGQVTTPKVQNGALSDDSDQADIAGAAAAALADADSGKCVLIDVYRPQGRYVRPVVTRGTQNAVLQAIIAIQYQGRRIPPGSTADGTAQFAGKDTSVKQIVIVPGT
jgi:hypothetical protein